jgi:hypothetical protein
MKNIVPTLDPQVALLKAMELVFESQQRCLWEGCDMEARIRRRFFDEVGLRKNGTPFAGWVVGMGNPAWWDIAELRMRIWWKKSSSVWMRRESEKPSGARVRRPERTYDQFWVQSSEV